jgi:hypothetical protein
MLVLEGRAHGDKLLVKTVVVTCVQILLHRGDGRVVAAGVARELESLEGRLGSIQRMLLL